MELEIGQQLKTLITKPEHLNSVTETNIAERERKIHVCVCSCVSAQIYIAAIFKVLIVETYSRFPIISTHPFAVSAAPQPSVPPTLLQVKESITPALKNLKTSEEGLHLADTNSRRFRLDKSSSSNVQ